MNSKYIVKQNGFKDCGPSCLLSIMKYYGCEASHEEVSYILKTNNNGTNAFNIINGARSFGFDGYGIHYTYDEIINRKTSFPIICHVQKDNMYHFIVVYGIKKDYLIIMDPSSDIHKINKDEFKNIYLNTSIVIYPIKKFEHINNHKQLFSFIFDYIKEEKIKTIKTIILSLLLVILGIILNYYSLICIDYILPNYKYKLLINISLLFMIMFIIKSILSFIRSKYLINIEKNITIKLNHDILVKLFNLPYQFFKNKSTGEAISRINDLKEFKEILTLIISNLSLDIILVIVSIIVLLILNLKLFIINFIGLFLYFIVVLIFRNTNTIKCENMLLSEGEYNKILNDNICGYETNKNLNMLNESTKEINFKFESYIYHLSSYEKILNIEVFIKDMIVNIIFIISNFLSIKYINDGIISIGEYMLFNSILFYFTEPLKNIFDLEPNLNYIKNVYNRINDLIIMNEIKEEDDINTIKGDINICNLSYSHDGIKNVIDNVNMNVKYGSKYLIYGKSGTGKSTIVKILLKYLKDYKGEIYLGNINLKDISSKNISYNMTYVSQNSYLKNDTLKNNIICNRFIDINDYEKVIDICNLNNLRDSKKLRNDFLIEDNGFNISGGQRQKIILARSLLKKSNYLILDEALSEVGLEEEKEIINKIFEYFKGKTIIYISHKKEIINMFDLKYEIERSEVHE